MKWIKRILLAIVVLVVGASGIAFLLPNKAAASRSVVIARPPSLVYAMLDGYGRFNEWSPWAKKDPATKYTFSGPARGVGAKLAWASEHPDVGSGSQTIARLDPGKRVETALDFGDFGTANAYFDLAAEGEGTRVTWGFDSELPIKFDKSFLFGVIGRFMKGSIEKNVGADYDLGLANLKALVEKLPNTDIAGVVATEATVEAKPAYVIEGLTASFDATASAQVLGGAYGEISGFAKAGGIALAGAPYTVVTAHTADSWSFDAGIPVERNDAAPAGRVKAASTFAGKVVDFKHVGPYDKLVDTHTKATAWLAVSGKKETGHRIELYVSDPATTAPEALETTVRVPIE